MNLAAETEQYQTLLEHHRMRPDDEETWTLLVQAREAMKVAWMEHTVGPIEA